MNSCKTACYIVVSYLLTACSFNGTFHRPSQIAPITELTHYLADKDTFHIEYDQLSAEIILKDSRLKVINQNYSIRNKYFSGYSGNKLNGWLITPNNIEPVATILHYHGSAGNLLTQYQLIIPLIEFGYRIFIFDYSGYGSSEGTSSHESVLQDAYLALEYLQKEEIKDSKLIIYGQSYGGYLATIVGSNRQQKFDGLVIEGAFSSFKEEARHKASIFGHFVKNGFLADLEIMKNYKPLLVIHSREDQMVPIGLGRKIYDNANDPKEFYEVNGPHIGGLENYSKEIASRINQMVNN